VAYSQISFNQLTQALATRLGDPGMLFWLPGELQSYLKESLRAWQAFSNFTSDQQGFSTTADVMFYDLFTLIPELEPTITDQDILQDIQRVLQEPVSPTAWLGNPDQFSLAGVVAAIQKRRDKFLVETGLVQNFSLVVGPTPPDGELELDQTTIDVRHAMWLDSSGAYTKLWDADTFMLTAGSQSWTIPDVPIDFTTFFSNPLVLLLAPPPAIGMGGQVHLLTVNSGPNLNPAAGPTVLGIPDDLCWVIKYGALADLFGQDGPGQDVGRAQYCETRWSDGIKLARITNYIRLGYNQGVPSFVDALEELDTADPNWMNETPGPPNSLVVSGNIVGVEPPPDQVYPLSFTIIPKFPVPVVGGDYIQVGQELIDSILDYAQHIAMLKEGDGSVQETMSLLQNFVKQAAIENDILRARAVDFDVLSDRTLKEENLNPRRRSDITNAPQDANSPQ
jgi:hypothetical protein